MKRIAIALAGILAASLISGCQLLGDRKFWYKQGPGDHARGQEQAQQADAAAARAPARQLEVAPQLVTQAPPQARAPQGATAARVDEAPIGGGYTQATRYGDMLFVSGQIGMDLRTNAFDERASVEQQTRQAMENIRQILEAHRLTMANVVSATVFLRNMGDYRAMDTAYESYFRSTLPSRSVVEVSRLPRNAAVEISVIAGR